MEKSWIDSEDGRLAIAELSSLPETRNIVNAGGMKKLNEMSLQIVEMSIADPLSDRKLLIAKAELDGARKMLKYFQDLFGPSRQGKRHG